MTIKSVNNIKEIDDICNFIASRVREIAYSLSLGDIKGEDLFRDFLDNYSGDEITEERAFIAPVLFDGKNYVLQVDKYFSETDDLFKIDNRHDIPVWLRRPNRRTAYRDLKGTAMYALCLNVFHDYNEFSLEEAESMGFVKESGEDDPKIWIRPITARDLRCEIQPAWKEEEIVFSEDNRDVNVIVKMWDEGNESNPSFFKINMIYYSSDGFQPSKVTRVTPNTKEIVVFS